MREKVERVRFVGKLLRRVLAVALADKPLRNVLFSVESELLRAERDLSEKNLPSSNSPPVDTTPSSSYFVLASKILHT